MSFLIKLFLCKQETYKNLKFFINTFHCYVAVFAHDREITRTEENLLNLFHKKTILIDKKQNFRELLIN